MADEAPTASNCETPGAPSLAEQAAGAAAGAVMGGFIVGPVGGVIGAALGPYMTELLRRAANEVLPWRNQSAALALTATAERLSLTPEGVVDMAVADGERTQLLAATLSAASNTANEQKIRALARALARGLRDDDARVDEELLVVAALADVEAPHIKVLTQLGPERTPSRITNSNLRSRTAPRRGMRPELLADESRLSLPGVRAVLAVLERAGMASADVSAETRRLEGLIYELQQEVNKLTELSIKPAAKPPTGSRKPKKLDRPGSPARVGWSMSAFGQVCLDYLEDLDPEDDWGVVREADGGGGEGPPDIGLEG